MRKEEIVAGTANLFEFKHQSMRVEKYENVKISILYFTTCDVLTVSTGTFDDDNVGGFLDVWGE